MPKTFWNGEPCNAVRGTGVVADDPVAAVRAAGEDLGLFGEDTA